MLLTDTDGPCLPLVKIRLSGISMKPELSLRGEFIKHNPHEMPAQTRLIPLQMELGENILQRIIFFNFQNFGFAFIWLIALWVLILLMILSFRKVDKLAAWLQIPYLLWVTFAAYLNFGVWLLNR